MAEYTYGKDFAIRTETDCIATENDFGQYVGRITAVKIKTNADRIRQMTDDELAEWIVDQVRGKYIYGYGDPIQAMVDWLRKEANEKEM